MQPNTSHQSSEESDRLARCVLSFLDDPDVRRAESAFRQLLAGPAVTGLIGELMVHLRHPHSGVRRRAVQLLRVAGSHSLPAMPIFIEMLSDPSWPVREVVVQTLANLPVPASEVLPLFTECALHDPQPLVREAAGRAAARHGADCRHYAEALRHPHASIRQRAVEAVCNIPPCGEVVNALRAALEDGHVKVRLAAVRGLADCGPEGVASIPRLIRCAFEGDGRMRQAAVASLNKLLDQAAAESLRWMKSHDWTNPRDLLHAGLERTDLPESVREGFLETCRRRQRWHRQRRGPVTEPVETANDLSSAWESAQAAVAQAQPDGERELAWLVGSLGGMWLDQPQ